MFQITPFEQTVHQAEIELLKLLRTMDIRCAKIHLEKFYDSIVIQAAVHHYRYGEPIKKY